MRVKTKSETGDSLATHALGGRKVHARRSKIESLSNLLHRKKVLFPFNMPRCYQICIAHCLDSDRDDLLETLLKITNQHSKKSGGGGGTTPIAPGTGFVYL